MIIVIVRLFGAALRCGRVVALLGRSLYRAMIARRARSVPNGLSDNLLRDIGLTRSDISFIADAIACGDRDFSRDTPGWHAFANLTGQDVRATVAFRKRLPPAKNKVPGPFGPNEKPTSFVMKIVPPAADAMAVPVPD